MKARNFLGIFLLLGVALLCMPIFWIETSCVAPQAAATTQPFPGLDGDRDYRRAAGDTFMIYPEWYVIDAYGDLAATAQQSSESAFEYGSAIGGFWSTLCATTQAASHSGPIETQRKANNYWVGYVFTAEMALKGVWERTIGAAAVWIRGPVRTSEDQFGVATLADYAAFLKRTPGGHYPFAQEFDRFWKETPSDGEARARKWERRVLFLMEYKLRDLYAHPGYLGSKAPADQRVQSVAKLDASDLASEPLIRKVRDLVGNAVLIETPRGAELADVVKKLGARGRGFVEIAGARRVLTTILAPPDRSIDFGGARQIFAEPVQSRPGWRRIGLDTDVAALAAQPALVEGQGAIFERVYE